MTWETALTPTLEQTLNLILTNLAKFFGTTTEAIMANAPEWLAKYGWYVTVHDDIPSVLPGGFILGIMFAGIFLFLWGCVHDRISTKAAIFSICLFFFVIVCSIAIPIITCLIAPEIVGLEAAIELIS